MFKNKPVEIPLVFNGYPVPFMAKICKIAQDILNEIDPKGYNPTPFVKKNDVGCEAVFKTQAMADKVEEIMSDVATQDFPIESHRVIEICFHIAIEDDSPENFIYHIESDSFFICHPDPGYAEHICGRMKEFFDRHTFQLPVVLIADLIESGSCISGPSIRSPSVIQPFDSPTGALWVRTDSEKARFRVNGRTGEDGLRRASED